MAKLTNAQIDALVNEARTRIEEANKSLVEKFAKTNKKLAELSKLGKLKDKLDEEKDAVNKKIQNLRDDIQSDKEFKKMNLSVDYHGKPYVVTYAMSSDLRHKLTLLTINKDMDVETIIKELVKGYC